MNEVTMQPDDLDVLWLDHARRVHFSGVEHAALTKEEFRTLLEAYADARVREALEEAARTVESYHTNFQLNDVRYEMRQLHATGPAKAIRALIPPLPGPAEP